jgi:hypothetical protein
MREDTMKKLFMILIIVGIALGLSGVTYAAFPYQNVDFVEVDSKANASTDCLATLNCIIRHYSGGPYRFSVYDSVQDRI